MRERTIAAGGSIEADNRAAGADARTSHRGPAGIVADAHAMTFVGRLRTAWATKRTMLCVGLDPEPAKFPPHLVASSPRDRVVFDFCRAIVDATHDLVCAFKPQIAHFAANRAEDQLEALIDYIHERHPDVPVVLDAKRGDVGSTSEQYAREVFERYDADAVTLQPYQGYDAIAPYFAYEGRGTIILCRTSNPSGDELQALPLAGPHDEPLYLRVARLVAERWNTSGQCGLVVGATYPTELGAVRRVVGDLPILVPGIGAQGGDLDASVGHGATAGGGLLVSSSRAILYAARDESFAEAARREAITTRDAIEAARRRAGR